MNRFQLYQRLRAQATRFFGASDARRNRVIRTEVIVEQEERLWLIPYSVARGSTLKAETGGNGNSLQESLPPRARRAATARIGEPD